MREEFEGQHRAMIELANAVLAIADRRSAEHTGELNRLRLALSRTITAHCRREGELLKQVAATLPATVSQRYHEELLKWRHDLIACNSDWPPERVWADPAGFKAAYRPIVAALEARIAWEREAVYPVILPQAA
jgi:hypothetical protein